MLKFGATIVYHLKIQHRENYQQDSIRIYCIQFNCVWRENGTSASEYPVHHVG